MDRKTLGTRLVILIVAIFALNFLANKLYWYSSIWWFDMPMHALGGFWLSLVALYLLSPGGLTEFSTKHIFIIIVWVLVIGVGWELFEIFFNNYLAHAPFNTLDTLSDIFFDLTGGMIGLVYYARTFVSPIGNTV